MLMTVLTNVCKIAPPLQTTLQTIKQEHVFQTVQMELSLTQAPELAYKTAQIIQEPMQSQYPGFVKTRAHFQLIPHNLQTNVCLCVLIIL